MKRHATVEKYGTKAAELSSLSLLKNSVLLIAIQAIATTTSPHFSFVPLNILF